MNANVYDTAKREAHGLKWTIEWRYDPDFGEPWKEHDGHGPVSDWTSRDKLPGEMVLAKDRGSCMFYDFAGAVKLARADGWGAMNTDGTDWPSKGAQAAAAAMEDFKRMRGWANDDWHWCGVVVKLSGTDIEASLWGIESDAGDYFNEVIEELMQECLQTRDAKTYPVTECGV